ncbi:hypothetical protein [Rhodothermus bifroesti]|uniref:Uncharacterized protein n=1 Tax=Rhodothermus marinus TaxID=29549 RepID=A0A7V2B218_RHOMR|nr:hypothetical protein [Rhodothermus bifroesti]GBD00432.1 hypothetical protein HRbin18_00139 [bacterium HR18]
MLSHDAIIDHCLALSPEVRYVAVYRDELLRYRERPGLAGASSGESDKYEELFVNPSVLTLVRQRGNIDCGGLRYVVIRYGNFFQCVFPVAGGHVSVALEPSVDLPRFLDMFEAKLPEWVGAA